MDTVAGQRYSVVCYVLAIRDRHNGTDLSEFGVNAIHPKDIQRYHELSSIPCMKDLGE